LLVWDPPAALEALFVQIGPAPAKAGVEALLRARADPPVRVEARAGQASDMLAAAEALRTARADPPGQAELLLTTPGPGLAAAKAGIEAASEAAGDLYLPAEFLLAAAAPAKAAVEALLTARGAIPAFVGTAEWAAIFRTDVLSPGEAIVIVRVDPQTPA